MRKAQVYIHDTLAGILAEDSLKKGWRFTYAADYAGPPVSLTLPVRSQPYEFESFPPFLEGLLPEGYNLEALMRARKIDRNDLFGQLLAVGEDMVGALTVKAGE